MGILVYILFLIFIVFKKKPYHIRRMEELKNKSTSAYRAGKIIAVFSAVTGGLLLITLLVVTFL